MYVRGGQLTDTVHDDGSTLGHTEEGDAHGLQLLLQLAFHDGGCGLGLVHLVALLEFPARTCNPREKKASDRLFPIASR